MTERDQKTSVSSRVLAYAFTALAGLFGSAAAGAAPPEDWQDRVIYFALLDRFENGDSKNDFAHGALECNNSADPHAYQGGDLEGLRLRLPDLVDLGVDALWITPLYKGVEAKEGANCGFPGYWADFAEPYELDLDPRFGTAVEFDRLLSESKRLGFRSILDMVVNHAGYGATLTEQRPEWFHDERTCSTLGSPEVFCPLAGLPDFNHRNREAARYLTDLHNAWTERFSLDGIRMDTVKHVEPAYFQSWIRDMKTSKRDMFVFGELLDEGSYDAYGPYVESGFDGLFNFPFRRSLIASFAKGGSVDHVASRMKDVIGRFGQRQTRFFVTLLDNHDVPRFMEEFPRGMDAAVVRERYELALTALFSLPGIPQITYGNEVGMYGGADPDNRRMMPDWAFRPPLNASDRPGFVSSPGQVWAHLQRLITLRKSHLALSRGDYDEIWRQTQGAAPNVLAFVRHLPLALSDNSAQAEGKVREPVLVIINNGDRASGPLRLPLRGHFGSEAVLKPLTLGGSSAQDSSAAYPVRGDVLEVDLPARSALLLTQGEAK